MITELAQMKIFALKVLQPGDAAIIFFLKVVEIKIRQHFEYKKIFRYSY